MAQRGADIGVSEQVFHYHDVYATRCEPGSKRMAEHMPRHLAESRAFHGRRKSTLTRQNRSPVIGRWKTYGPYWMAGLDSITPKAASLSGMLSVRWFSLPSSLFVGAPHPRPPIAH
jgi:hypothetical protein